MRYILGILIVFLFAFCKKDNPANPEPVFRNAQLKITVLRHYSDSTGAKRDSTLYHARVALFQTEDDRANNINTEHTGDTDKKGEILFTSLQKKYYYITISYSGFKTVYDEVSTPDNARAIELIIF